MSKITFYSGVVNYRKAEVWKIEFQAVLSAPTAFETVMAPDHLHFLSNAEAVGYDPTTSRLMRPVLCQLSYEPACNNLWHLKITRPSHVF